MGRWQPCVGRRCAYLSQSANVERVVSVAHEHFSSSGGSDDCSHQAEQVKCRATCDPPVVVSMIQRPFHVVAAVLQLANEASKHKTERRSRALVPAHRRREQVGMLTDPLSSFPSCAAPSCVHARALALVVGGVSYVPLAPCMFRSPEGILSCASDFWIFFLDDQQKNKMGTAVAVIPY